MAETGAFSRRPVKINRRFAGSTGPSVYAGSLTAILRQAELELWEQAQATGVYRQSTRGATLAELPVVASFICADYSGELVVLEPDEIAIAATGIAIRFEDGGNGELFPHLYGELKIEWVRATHPAAMIGGTLSVPGFEGARGATA